MEKIKTITNKEAEREYYNSLRELEQLRDFLDYTAKDIYNISEFLGTRNYHETIDRIMNGRKRKALKGLLTKEINRLKKNKKLIERL